VKEENEEDEEALLMTPTEMNKRGKCLLVS
jgi:hypothetical protein